MHIYGHPCDMDSLTEVSTLFNLKIIEDCAQAHGAEYKGKKVGTIGDIGCFSFYPGKNLGAYGDAGAIVTNNKELYFKCQMIANHGRTDKYEHQFEGRNSRLDGLQAAVLDVKLRYLNKWTDYRIMVAEEYLKQLRDVTEITLPVRKKWAKQVYHLFVIRCKNRDLLREYLNDSAIHTGIHYPVSLPNLKAYSYNNQANEKLFGWNAGSQLLSLPIGEHLSKNDISVITNKVRNYYL